MYSLRQNGKPRVDLFKDNTFVDFHSSLDYEMKGLQSKGIGSTNRQPKPLTVDEEETLWQGRILGDHNPQSLIYIVFFMIGFYFTLRSGDEHRQLQYNPYQIQIVEKLRESPHLQYTEDVPCSRKFSRGPIFMVFADYHLSMKIKPTK